MKNKELFDRTIGILVKAYFEGTLIKGDYCACAVGNLIVANCGYKIIPSEYVDEDGGSKLRWDKASAEDWYQEIVSPFFGTSYPSKIVIDQINKTGYDIRDILFIESAFEKGETEFDGLMKVCDILMQIHEATPEEAESAKLQFVKA